MDFPNLRKEYPALGNPLYVTDLVNATEGILKAMKAVLGLGDTDFYIISGMEYTSSGGGSYTPGIVYMDGVFYFSNSTLVEGKYLAPNLTDYLSEPFDDTVSRYIYQLNYATTSNTSVTGGSPVPFTGNMNTYRLNVKVVNDSLVDYGKPTDLGDKTAADFITTDITSGGAIHSLDISSKIPLGAKFVLIRVYMLPSAETDYISLFKYGNTHDFCSALIAAGTMMNYPTAMDCWVAVDSNRKIDYKAIITSPTTIALTIAGWM
jgi:hypothetical protein